MMMRTFSNNIAYYMPNEHSLMMNGAKPYNMQFNIQSIENGQ